jgi:hypothetical protein
MCIGSDDELYNQNTALKMYANSIHYAHDLFLVS